MRIRGPLQHVKTVRSRGHVYHYFDTGRDVHGKRVYKRLPAKSDPMFGTVYSALSAARTRREHVAETPTVKTTSRAYQLDRKFKKLSNSSQSTYLIYLRALDIEMGDAPVGDVKRSDVRHMLDKMASTPGAANMLLIVTRNVFSYAAEREWVQINPTAEIRAFEKGEETHEPWPEALVMEALSDPAVQLPVALLYYTAQRIGDVCKMRWADVSDGYIEVAQQKTKKDLDIRLHDDLRTILKATPRTALTILHGADGKPMRVPALRSQLQAWAKKRGHEVVPHGLRKNAVNALLEAGCSVGETSAISGQSLGMVERYAKRRNNRKMGSAAILKWERNAS